jgi:SAM-dependent methyltransferase
VRADTLALVRCPYCAGRVELKTHLFHRRDQDVVTDGVLGCHCCYFVVVSGIAVLTLAAPADTARQQIEAGDTDAALLTMLGVDGATAAVLRDPAATYRGCVERLGAAFEGGYFLYRFSDPTFLVADAVVRSLASAVLPRDGRAIDLCGGSGHLTRTLLSASTAPPVLMDLSFVKLWLARRFTAVGCDAVCADAHAPLPFASGAFRLAVCNDAFHYIWTKALFAREMLRIVDEPGVAAVTHVHNAEQWNPSAGNPLPPVGYLALFEGVDARVFAERGLLSDVLDSRLDLARRDPPEILSADPSLTVVASRGADVFRACGVEACAAPQGRLAVNPLYAVARRGSDVVLSLRFPSHDYEDEYAASRQYLPGEITIPASALSMIEAGVEPPDAPRLRASRVLLDLPLHYL